jgi:hypothetical protein
VGMPEEEADLWSTEQRGFTGQYIGCKKRGCRASQVTRNQGSGLRVTKPLKDREGTHQPPSCIILRLGFRVL